MHSNPMATDSAQEPAVNPSSTQRATARCRAWILGDIVVPFLATRCVLFLVAWLSDMFVANPRYPLAQAARQGWQFTPLRWLDMWGRWDSGWYMNIALHGYSSSPAYESVQSSIAFFPLFPMAVRAVLWVLPSSMQNQSAALLVGVGLANAALLVALVAIRQLVVQFADEHAARRAVIYVVTFPTGFFLSCFYPESLFLAMSALACLLATRNRWLMASFVGAMAALSRPHGMTILLPLLWLYLSSREWRVRRVRWDILYLLLIPAALAGFLLLVYPLTRNLLAPFGAQAAWHRHLSSPWSTLTSSLYFEGAITRIQQVLAVTVFVFSLWALTRLPSRGYGLYALVITIPSLMSGTLMGIGRHAAVVFPLYIMLAVMSKRDQVHRILQAMNLTVQVLFMAAWIRFYPVV